jgi:hypothetical protein
MLTLLLLYIPALLAYLKTEHVAKDQYAVRKNACSVLREYISLASLPPSDGPSRADHVDKLRLALEKCKKSTDDPGALAYGSLLVMHEALSKKSPMMERPVDDVQDTCHKDAWNHESSYIRELFGMQLDHPGLGITHPFVVDARQTKQETLPQAIREVMGNVTTVRRAPLMLMCLLQPGTSVTSEMVFGHVDYSLFAMATADSVVVRGDQAWHRYAAGGQACGKMARIQDIYRLKPHAVVFQRQCR